MTDEGSQDSKIQQSLDLVEKLHLAFGDAASSHSELFAYQLDEAWWCARQLQKKIEELASSGNRSDALSVFIYLRSFDEQYHWFLKGIETVLQGLPESRRFEAEGIPDSIKSWWRNEATRPEAARRIVNLRHAARKAAGDLSGLGLIYLEDEAPPKARQRFRRIVKRVHDYSAALLDLMAKR